MFERPQSPWTTQWSGTSDTELKQFYSWRALHCIFKSWWPTVTSFRGSVQRVLSCFKRYKVALEYYDNIRHNSHQRQINSHGDEIQARKDFNVTSCCHLVLSHWSLPSLAVPTISRFRWFSTLQRSVCLDCLFCKFRE